MASDQRKRNVKAIRAGWRARCARDGLTCWPARRAGWRDPAQVDCGPPFNAGRGSFAQIGQLAMAGADARCAPAATHATASGPPSSLQIRCRSAAFPRNTSRRPPSAPAGCASTNASRACLHASNASHASVSGHSHATNRNNRSSTLWPLGAPCRVTTSPSCTRCCWRNIVRDQAPSAGLVERSRRWPYHDKERELSTGQGFVILFRTACRAKRSSHGSSSTIRSQRETRPPSVFTA
jgi:hypothetical protein